MSFALGKARAQTFDLASDVPAVIHEIVDPDGDAIDEH